MPRRILSLFIVLVLLSLTACQEPIILSPDAVLPDGSEYQGGIKDGLFHGEGKLLYQHGGYYEGAFRNGTFEGNGVFVSREGRRYEGDFKAGYFHGSGQLTHLDGSHYQGEFQRGYMHGQGTFIDDEENRYEGSFKQNLYDGEGKYTRADGSVYEGEFKAGKYHGQGRYTQGETIYEGTFVKGTLTGQGSFSSDEGSRYEGEMKDWLPAGKGRSTDAEGNVFIGTFDSGYLSGEGEMIGVDGSHYKGSFDYGEFDGTGVLTNADKSVYEGEFSYGQYHGQGTLAKVLAASTEPVVESGKWRRGKLVHSSDSGLPEHHQAELALTHHQRLLDESLAAVLPEDPSSSDVYFLGVAGDGSQSVFRRELEYIKDQIETRYGNAGRTLSLINHHDSAQIYPLATTHSVTHAIKSLAEKMNTEQDILFLYFSSHGSEGHELYLNHDSIKLPNLSADALAEALKASSVKWKVIMISACYSGGFVDKLEDENTLVMTAADSKSTSFGCSEESEMTYFGKAYFREVLANEPQLSLVDAFEKAKNLVDQWEKEQELSSSNPVISAPQPILKKLAMLSTNLPQAKQDRATQTDQLPVLD